MARIWNKEGKFLLFDVDKGNHDDAARLVIVIKNIFKENLVSAFCCGACFVDCVVMTLKAKKDLRRFGNVCPYKKAEDKKTKILEIGSHHFVVYAEPLLEGLTDFDDRLLWLCLAQPH